MAGTEDVFMEVINELSASFGGTPTAEQLSEACDLSLDEAQQVLSELGLLPGRNAPKPPLPRLQLPSLQLPSPLLYHLWLLEMSLMKRSSQNLGLVLCVLCSLEL